MFTNQKNDSLRFFSNSSLIKHDHKAENQSEEAIPFGLQYQEAVSGLGPDSPKDGVTMSQCPTYVPQSTDSCLDIDYQ